MAYDSPGGTSGDSLSWSYHGIIMQRINGMALASAAGNRAQEWAHFKYAFRMLTPYMIVEDKKRTELAWQELDRRIEALKARVEKKEISETTKDDLELDLRSAFVNAHLTYLFHAFDKAKIITISEEGDLDFDKLDMETIATIIRTERGMPAKLKDATEHMKEAADEKASV